MATRRTFEEPCPKCRTVVLGQTTGETWTIVGMVRGPKLAYTRAFKVPARALGPLVFDCPRCRTTITVHKTKSQKV